MTTNKEIQKIRDEEIRLAIKYFSGKCHCCTRTVHKKKRKKWTTTFVGFLYHHLEYRNGEPRRKDYQKGASGTWKYKKDVLPYVEKYHDKFLLLCTPHHAILEKLKRISDHHPEWLEAIILSVKMTKT
jgi:hypothetical protein